MSSVVEPKAVPTNRRGLTVKEYGGLKSTLCVGCGHDVITRQITQAFYEMGVDPHRVAKMSGIGCSSKTTAYVVDQNRDRQMFELLTLEVREECGKLRSIRHYDGFPLDAETVVEGVEAGEKS